MADQPKTLLAFDTETSGLKPELGQILTATMVAVDCESGEIIDRLEISIANRGDVIPQAGAVAVNRINPLRHKGIPESLASTKLRDFILKHGGTTTPFLGHNVEFDKRFLRNMLVRNGYDSNIVSLKSVDTITETARKIYKNEFPVDKLDSKVGSGGESRPTLNQSSVAKALGVEVDSSKAHTSAYDVDVNLEIWRKLGRPTAEDSNLFNSPYETEKRLAGKIVRSSEWDGRAGRVVERSYYVVGEGVKEEEDVFGKVKYAGTAMICVDGGDWVMAAADAVEAAEAAAADQVAAGSEAHGPENIWKNGEIRSLVARVAAERKFTSPTSFGITVEDPSDDQLEKLLLLSPYILSSIDDERRKEREKLYSGLLADASNSQFSLTDPNSKIGLLKLNDHHLVPGLAGDLGPMTTEQRLAHISQLANSQTPPRGASWAHGLLTMAERYGYRNGIAGFEVARVRELKRMMPPKIEPVVVSKTQADVEASFAKAMGDKGIERIEFSCNGKDVFIKLFDKEGLYLDRKRLEIRENSKEQVAYPLAVDIADALAELTGTSRAAALRARAGFSAFYDKSSYGVVKESFKLAAEKAKASGNEAGLVALEECLQDLGEGYAHFVEASTPQVQTAGFAKNAKGAPVAKKRGLENLKQYMDEAEAIRTAEIKKLRGGYDAVPGFSLPEAADSRLIIAANLKNPRVLSLKRLDAEALASGIQLHKTDGAFNGNAAMKMEPDFNEEEEVETTAKAKKKDKDKDKDEEDPALVARCKVCNREVKGKNAVAGMGPTCARKLEDWLDRPEIGVSDITTGKFKRLSDIKDGTGIFPIMVVKDIKSGRTFAADIINKEKDGRYLVVDLSELSKDKLSGRRKGQIKDCLKCYLDADNHEVARIFGSESNYYK